MWLWRIRLFAVLLLLLGQFATTTLGDESSASARIQN